MPKIQLTTTEGANLEFELSAGRATFGRAEDNDFVVPDGSVSSRHGEFQLTDDGMELVDLGSTNGTFVNGERVTRATIAPGGKFKLGSVEGVLVSDAPASDIGDSLVDKTTEGESSVSSSGGEIAQSWGGMSGGNVAEITGLGATPCPTGQRSGFGPKVREKDKVAGMLMMLGVIALIICAAAAFLIFKMEA